MEEKSRTEHSVQNTTTAIIAKMIALLTGFITRVVFTHCLSQTYVGINGLFWDILQRNAIIHMLMNKWDQCEK